MSLRFVQFAFSASEEANYQSSFYEVSPCETSPYEAKDFALKFAVQCEAKDVFARKFAVRGERYFRLKLRRARRKTFSPKTSPYEAKDIFAQEFAV